MSALAEKNQGSFSIKSFLIGLVIVFGVYVLLFGFAFINSEKTIEGLEARLASQTLFIQEVASSDVVIPDESANGQMAEEPHHEMAVHQPEATVAVEPLMDSDMQTAPEPASDTSMDEDLAALVGASNNALVPAPIKELTEVTSQGLLPKKTAELTPFNAYKKPFLINRSKNALAIGVLDYGLSEGLSKNILAFLPSSVSLILSPYSSDAERWQKMAREDGHEIWLQMNIQTEEFPKSDPGSQAFLSNVSFKYNQDKLHWLLSRTTGYAGVAGFTDESFKYGGAMYKTLVTEIFTRGEGFLEMNPMNAGFVREFAVDGGFPYVENTKVLKNLSADNSELAAIKKALETQGGMTILIKPTPKNLKDLKTWISKLERENIQIVPVSALAALATE